MHCLATSFDEHVFYLMLWGGAGFWALARLSKKSGTDGMVKDAAKRGVTNFISRLLK